MPNSTRAMARMTGVSKSTSQRDSAAAGLTELGYRLTHGLDGKTYAVIHPEARKLFIGEVHRLRCDEELTIREIRQHLADRNFPVSQGTVANYINRFRCEVCSPAPFGTPEQGEVGEAK